MIPELAKNLHNPLFKWVKSNLCNNNKLFLVGGSVRDLLLKRPVNDYDFLLEGDVFTFANKLAQQLNCRYTVNELLLTASLETKWGIMDIVQARKEVYDYPGAMPKVYPSSWMEDLKRRDFSINTLAIPLTPQGWGNLIDLFAGYRDLCGRKIRILHNQSFQDDPTRILRAIRFKNRLNFLWDEETISCLQRDWHYLQGISSSRRLKEWLLLCEETQFAECLQDLYLLGGWQFFLGDIVYSPETVKWLSALRRQAVEEGLRAWFLILLGLLYHTPSQLEFIGEYWGLAKKDYYDLARTFHVLPEILVFYRQGKRKAYQLLQDLSVEGMYFIYQLVVKQEKDMDLVWQDFYERITSTRMPLKGQDLLEMGFNSGPTLGCILNKLEKCFWEEMFYSREEGLVLARQLIKEDNT